MESQIFLNTPFAKKRINIIWMAIQYSNLSSNSPGYCL